MRATDRATDVLTLLREPPPRGDTVSARIARLLRPRVWTTLDHREASVAVGIGIGIGLASTLPISLCVLGAMFVGKGVLGVWSRRWIRRLAREGVLVECEVSGAPDRTLLATFTLAGVATTARAHLSTSTHVFTGTAYCVCLPDARPRYVTVLGPEGPVPFKLDPIAMPDAKMLRR